MTPTNETDSWVAVARVLRPHGLRGTFRLKPLTRDLDDLLEAPVRTFHVRRGSTIEGTLTVDSMKLAKDVILAKFQNIKDRSEAEKYINTDLVISEAERWDLPDGQYYIDHLEGIDVRDAKTGQVIGKVKTAREGAAHDYLVLELEAVPGKETLLPIHPEFVKRIDIGGKFAEVTIPEGLLD